jgi:hypothetical protein
VPLDWQTPVSTAEIVDAGQPPLAARQRTPILASLGEERAWIIVMAAVTAAEFAWWSVAWSLGYAPAPFLLTYLGLAFAGLACAVALRAVFHPKGQSPSWSGVIPATIFVGVGASLFLPLKYAIPHLVPFWLDPPLAEAERTIFTADPWLLLDRLFGWADVAIDQLYALWLPLQTLILFTVIIQRPSPAKSRALIAYFLAWSLLGVVAALAFSSAGPILHDRIFGGSEFAGLGETLRKRGAWLALAESDKMWASLASDRPGIVAGISAMPSIHVAISVWILLAARTMAPRAAPFALGYVAFIWIASVQLGWHYVTDGLVAVLGMLLIWALSSLILRRLGLPPRVSAGAGPLPPA